MRRKNISLTVLALLLISFLFCGLSVNIVGDSVKEIKGTNITNQRINATQEIYYNFTDYNVYYGFKTDSNLTLNVDLGPNIESRQLFLDVKNGGNPLTLSLISKSSMSDFNLQKQPNSPSQQNYRFQYRYNNIIKFHVNRSVSNITARFQLNQEYGLSKDKEYQITVFKENYESWEPVSTERVINDTTDTIYLEAQFPDLDETEDFYITLFEVSPITPTFDWIWILVISGVGIGIVALFIIMSKSQYFEMLRKRIVSIDKGAHRLTMEEVLENENRNKIIECILEDPGIHYNELLRKTELSPGNLAWHLDILDTYKIIGKKRVGKYLVYFPYYQKNPISNIDLKLQKSELTLKVLEMIESNPGTYNSKISNELNVDHKTVSYHIDKLKDLDLVYSEKDGRKKKLYPNLDAEYFKKNGSD